VADDAIAAPPGFTLDAPPAPSGDHAPAAAISPPPGFALDAQAEPQAQARTAEPKKEGGFWRNVGAGLAGASESLNSLMMPGLIERAGHELFGTPTTAGHIEQSAENLHIAPSQVEEKTPGDYIGRGVGSMLASPVMPEAGGASALGRAAAETVATGAGMGAGQYAGEKVAGPTGGVIASIPGAMLGHAALDSALDITAPWRKSEGRAVRQVTRNTDLAPEDMRAAVAAPSEPLFPGDQPTLAAKIPDQRLALAQRASEATTPQPFLKQRAAEDTARAKAMQDVAPSANVGPVDVAQAFRSQLDAIHEAHAATVRGAVRALAPDAAPPSTEFDPAADAAQQTIMRHAEALGGQDVAANGQTAGQIRGGRAREVVQQATAAAKARLDQLWDTVRQSGVVQFDGSPVGEAARRLEEEIPKPTGERGPVNTGLVDENGAPIIRAPKSGEPPNNATLGAALPFVTTLKQWNGPVSMDTLRAERMTITNAIERAYSPLQPDRLAGRRLSILRDAIDDALDRGIVAKAQEQDRAVAAGQIDGSQTLAADLQSVVDGWRTGRGSGQLVSARVAGGPGNPGRPSQGGMAAVPGGGRTETSSGGQGGGGAGNPGVAAPDGSLTPDEAAAAYDRARVANREFQSVHGDKTPTARALKAGPYGGSYATPDSGVIPLYFKPGPGGAETIQNLVQVVGPQQAEGVIRDQAAASLLHEATRDGRIVVPKWRTWMDRYGAALDPFPALRQQFSRPADAQAALDDVTASHTNAVSSFQKSALGDWLKADPDKAAATLFQGQDRVARAAELSSNLRVPWAQPNAAALEGLRRSVWDEFMRRVVPGYDATSPPEPAETRLKPQRFQDVFRDNRAMLGKVLDPEHLQTLEGVSKSLARDQMVMDRVRERVGSNTARDARLIQQMEGRTSLLGMALSGSLDAATTAGATAAHGVSGGFAAHTAMKALGAIAKAVRQAGIGRKNDLLAEMYANPDFARAMFEQYSPGGVGGTAKRVVEALRAAPARVLPQAAAGAAAQSRRLP
jgi:hypothetical protein